MDETRGEARDAEARGALEIDREAWRCGKRKVPGRRGVAAWIIPVGGYFFGRRRRAEVQRHRELRDVAALERRDLACPCFFTSSIRSTECSGRKVRLTPANSLLMRSSPGSSTTVERSPKTSSSTSMKPNRLAVADLAGVDLVNLALIHEHNAENVTGWPWVSRGLRCYVEARHYMSGRAGDAGARDRAEFV